MNSGGFGFGSPSSFNSTNLFSSQNKQASLFGSTSSPSTTTGTSGGLFGSSNPTTTTPASTFSFSAGSTALGGTQQAGTGHIKFTPTTGQDTVNKNGSQQNITTNHQCITAMKEYELKSLEELRFEDYQANRKFPTSTASTFGGTNLFSSGATSTASSGFSSTGLFGSTTQAKPFGGFGSTTTTTTTTPTTSTGSLFGSTSTANRPFGFGSTTTTAPASTSFSGFGATQPSTTTTGFGATQPAQQTSLFGGIGSTTSTQPSTGLFGSTSTTPASTSGGLFGSTGQAKPFSFSSQPSSAFSFGSGTSTTPATTTQPSIFGQSSLTQSPLSTAKPFGQTTMGGFGTTGTTTGFGTGTATTTTTPSTNIFGSTTTQAKPAFGTGLGTTSTGTSGFGSFGTTATTQPSTGGIFGGFGTGTTTQPSTTSTPFGSGLGATSTTTTASPFGSTTTQPSIFGTSTQPSTTTTTGGLFGSTTPSTGFGTSTLSTGFGQPSTTTTTNAPSIFGPTGLGTTTTTPSTGLFGSTQPTTTGFGTGLGTGLGTTTTTGFGTSFGGLGGATTGASTGLGLGLTTQPAQTGIGLQPQTTGLQLTQAQTQPLVQQQLMALSNSPYGTASLLKSTLQDLNKKEDIFKPVSPVAQRPYITEATSPPKGLSSLTSDFKGGLSQTIKLQPKPLAQVSLNKKTDLFEGLEEEETPVFYPRKNIKKLLFKPSISDTNLASRRSTSANSSINGDQEKTTNFLLKPQQSQSQHQVKFQDENSTLGFGFPIQPKHPNITNDLTNVSDDGANGDNNSEISQPVQSQPHPANIVLERPGYFTIPSMQDLGALTDEKGNCFVENFAIGRVDYGCITFPGLTNLANMNLDEIIHIRRKEVHVYPDDTKKPQVGQGLNKPAEVTLHRIWPSDKQTKLPITDPNRVITMGFNKKIERATIEMGAQFIDYDPVTGSWTFKVKHFSKYGLNDSDDEEDEQEVLQSVKTLKPKLVQENGLEIEKEKKMIEKQLKLIESRRLELMQQKKSNLNSITNQQWDIINEYCAVQSTVSKTSENKQNKFIDNSNLHLELSSDEDEDNLKVPKALLLDNENETSDSSNSEDNKENNRLYPNLNTLLKQNRKSLNKKPEKLYPDLPELSEEVNKEALEISENEIKMENEERMDEVSLMPISARPSRKLVDAFFGDSDRIDADEYYSYNQTQDEDSQYNKFGSFSQKPITVGLLKRGLGGLSSLTQDNKLSIGGAELTSLSSSLKGDHFHGQSKVARQLQQPQPDKIENLVSLSLADVQQKIGPKALKPKLWNRYSIPKIAKLEPSGQYLDEAEKQELELSLNDARLKSLKLNIDNQVVPKLIELKDSITNNLTRCLVDAGLFNTRRFRVTWSLNPAAFTFTQLASLPKNSTFRNMIQLSTPCMINLGSNTQFYDYKSNPKLNTIKDNLEKYLNIQLELTNFLNLNPKKSKLSHLKTKYGNDLIKQMNECTQDMRNNIGDNPDADNIEHMKSVWSLCSMLWGDIPESYKSKQFDNNTNNQYELEQIRKRLLGEWLVQVSSHRIEKECKNSKFSKNKENYLSLVYTYLTANRLLDACNTAVENCDFRLALLLSQSSGSNDTVRTMLRKQLNEWYLTSSDKYLNQERLKLYVLISGELVFNLSEPKSQFLNVCENLDWKRQFGLHLWFHSLPINSITDAVVSFDNSVNDEICKKPVPAYIEDCVQNTTDSFDSNLYDTCYHLIKLYCNNTHSIEQLISPLTHTSNQLDFRLSWHLAMALVALNYNHLSKQCLETLHESYASQLQTIGLWDWSVFILMHIDDEKRRETLIRTYLSRNVSSESELNQNEKFLVEKLLIPAEWLYEYKALRAKYEHLHESQFLLLLKAHKWNEAHSVLVEYLAPELFVKHNFKTLNEYLNTLSKESILINKWNLGGQIYLDYIRLKENNFILFNFTDFETTEKIINDDLYKELNQMLINLSVRLKEFDTKNPKKLLVSMEISKLLLKYFEAFDELNLEVPSEHRIDEDFEDLEMSRQENLKILTKLMVEKAVQQTESIADQDLLRTMLIKKIKYSQNFFNQNSNY